MIYLQFEHELVVEEVSMLVKFIIKELDLRCYWDVFRHHSQLLQLLCDFLSHYHVLNLVLFR